MGRLLLAGHSHARIRRLDVGLAQRYPGVLAVLTHGEVPAVRYGSTIKDRTLFADGVVRFEGEVVAAVAALSAHAAAAATALIEVEYEPLTPVLDPEAALDASSPLVHPNWQSYKALDGIQRDRNDCAFVNIMKGDVAIGMAAADEVVSERYTSDMSHPVPIEPHAIVAQWQGEHLTVWTTSQVPFMARAGIAETLEIPESHVRVIVPHLGGGFGGKCDFHFEAHVAALARKAGRPVRLVFSRHDEFVATDKVSHPMVIELTSGIKRDGTITARQARIVMDTGAYASDAPGISEIVTMMVAGPYRIPNLAIEARTVYTNKTPAGSVRAPSGPQACWALEQHTDELAKRIGLDAYQIRARNLLAEGDEGPTGQRMTAVGAKACLDRAAEMIGYGKPLAPNEGIGLSCCWWFSLPAPSTASLKLNLDGSATLVTGAQENGSGAVMGLALIAAEELGIPVDKVAVLYQDTDGGFWDLGSSGSQTTYNNGRAVIAAAIAIRERLLEVVSSKLEAAPDDIEIRDGLVHVRGVSGRGITVAEAVAIAQANGVLMTAQAAPHPPGIPESFGTSCVGRVFFPAFADPTFACQAVRVEVDGETGVVHVIEVAAAHDFGRVLNRQGAEGQVEGGIVHGIGIALSEGTLYRQGRQLNPHLLDYKLQTTADAPTIQIAFIETAAVGGPRGAKGVGEPPIIPAAGAVGNAIAVATGRTVAQPADDTTTSLGVSSRQH